MFASPRADICEPLHVIVEPAEGLIQRILTPVRAGAVRIVAVNNGLLTLVSETGSRLTFNVSTKAFTSVASTLDSVGPAQLWIGLKNSDDVGTNFDLL
jgi:hypothetical protein